MNKSAYHPVLLYWGKDRLEEYAKHRRTQTHAFIHASTHAEGEVKNMDYV